MTVKSLKKTEKTIMRSLNLIDGKSQETVCAQQFADSAAEGLKTILAKIQQAIKSSEAIEAAAR